MYMGTPLVVNANRPHLAGQGLPFKPWILFLLPSF
jgi:hypothetical protein